MTSAKRSKITTPPTFIELINAPRVQGRAVLADGREIELETPRTWREPPKKPTNGTAWSRPLRSEAASVPPDMAQEYNEMYRSRGITGAYHDEKGDLYFSSRKQRAKCLQARGLVDKDGGYGDTYDG